MINLFALFARARESAVVLGLAALAGAIIGAVRRWRE